MKLGYPYVVDLWIFYNSQATSESLAAMSVGTNPSYPELGDTDVVHWFHPLYIEQLNFLTIFPPRTGISSHAGVMSSKGKKNFLYRVPGLLIKHTVHSI